MRTFYLHLERPTSDFLVAAERAGDLPPPSLLVLVGDECGRLVLPVAVDDVPDDPPQDERISALGVLLEQIAEFGRPSGVAMAVSRRGDPRPRGSDFGWHDALMQCCRIAGITCHGSYVVTPYGVRRVRPLPAPDLLAA
ncbi:MAG TPA: hypothetical protein VFY84_16160 [Jiangellales bacterium]|nr:hypothetical protein [Jiangellales bacterium]